MVLSPGTPVLLPHKIQNPNLTLARKFVTDVRSETHIKPHKFFGSFLLPYTQVSRVHYSFCLVACRR